MGHSEIYKIIAHCKALDVISIIFVLFYRFTTCRWIGQDIAGTQQRTGNIAKGAQANGRGARTGNCGKCMVVVWTWTNFPAYFMIFEKG